MNKLLNNLLGMYKQAKLNKKAESYKSKVAEMLNDINEPEPIMDYISESEAEKICKEINIPHENNWYKGDLFGYIDEVPEGMVDVLIEHISEEDAESLWRRIAQDMGMDVDAKKQTKMSKKAQDKESAKKDYTEQYAKVKEIMKEYGYGLSDGGYIYLISKEQPKDEGFQVKFKDDRLRVELDGKLKYSGYGPQAIEEFLQKAFYAKKQSSKAKTMRKRAFKKLTLKRAMHKTAGEFEEMMKLKSNDPKLIKYLAKEFGVEESTVSQYTDISENAEELYNILEQQANKYGYEWDKFEYDEYGDRIDEDDFRGDTDDLEKAVEYLKNNIDKSMFKFEYVGQYEENYLTFSVNEKLIPIEKPIIHITNYTKNYDISFFVESQKAKEEDKAEGIESNDSLTILLRRTSDEILNEIVNYVNVELPKKIAEQNKKQSSKVKAVRKQAKIELIENVWYKIFGYPLSLKYLGKDKGGRTRWEKADGTEVIFDANVEIEPYEYSYSSFKNAKSATIKHENGVYNVYSESGKCLGKGYKTKEEAEKRLKQVEYFKHKSSLKQVVISKMAENKK